MTEMHETLWRLVVAVAGAVLIALGTGGLNSLSGPDRALLLTASLVLSSLIMLAPPSAPRAGLSFQFTLAAVLAGVGALLLVAADARSLAALPLALRMALGVGVLVFGLGGLSLLLAQIIGPTAPWLVVVSLAAITATPLWLVPLLVYQEGLLSAIDAIVAINPLSYLATLADWDYLRGEWFYRHSPLGGLRYDYPHPLASTLVYLALGVASLGIARVRLGAVRPGDRQESIDDPLST